MSATYDPTLLTAVDRMRFLLGDMTVVPVDAALNPNETYVALVAQHGETEGTARAAEALAARFAQEPGSVALNGLAVSWATRSSTWLALAANLRKGLATAAPVAAGQVVRTVRAGETARSEYRRRGWVRWP